VGHLEVVGSHLGLKKVRLCHHSIDVQVHDEL